MAILHSYCNLFHKSMYRFRSKHLNFGIFILQYVANKKASWSCLGWLSIGWWNCFVLRFSCERLNDAKLVCHDMPTFFFLIWSPGKKNFAGFWRHILKHLIGKVKITIYSWKLTRGQDLWCSLASEKDTICLFIRIIIHYSDYLNVVLILLRM